MIGVDTNVLLRLFVGDDRGQLAKAQSLLARRSAGEPVYAFWSLSDRSDAPTAIPVMMFWHCSASCST